MALSQLMLDTSAYSAFMRGHDGVSAALRTVSQILIPATVLGELHAGFEYGGQCQKNTHLLNQFLTSPRVSTCTLGKDTALRYGQIYAYLRRNGRPIGSNDMWIAASAMEHGVELMTLDRDFLIMPQILVRLME